MILKLEADVKTSILRSKCPKTEGEDDVYEAEVISLASKPLESS